MQASYVHVNIPFQLHWDQNHKKKNPNGKKLQKYDHMFVISLLKHSHVLIFNPFKYEKKKLHISLDHSKKGIIVNTL